MKRKSFFTAVSLTFIVLGLIHIHCRLFEPPYAPENTKVTAVFRGADSKVYEVTLLDSIGKEIGIGAALCLPDNFDSLTLKILDDGDIVADTTARTFNDGYYYDTIWIRHTFRTPGRKHVTVTPFVNPERDSIVTWITIQGLSNAAPQWSVDTLRRNVKVGDELSQVLTEICNDAENDAITYTLIDGAPENDLIIGTTYQFKPTEQNAGTHIVQIEASDPTGNSSILPVKITVDISSEEPLSEYTVTFDGKGGNGTMEDQTIVSGMSASLSTMAY